VGRIARDPIRRGWRRATFPGSGKEGATFGSDRSSRASPFAEPGSLLPLTQPSQGKVARSAGWGHARDSGLVDRFRDLADSAIDLMVPEAQDQKPGFA
jgi:hypothetical protein